MSDSSKILIGQVGDIRWIRVEGKGSVQNAPGLKAYGAEAFEEGALRFVIDLENCGGMDSTFIGTMTGIALKVAGKDGEVGLANANARTIQLIRSLGLDAIFHIDESGQSWEEERKLVASGLMEATDSSCKQEKAEVSLEAHEALGEANAENIPRFRDVIDFLRKDLG